MPSADWAGSLPQAVASRTAAEAHGNHQLPEDAFGAFMIMTFPNDRGSALRAR